MGSYLWWIDYTTGSYSHSGTLYFPSYVSTFDKKLVCFMAIIRSTHVRAGDGNVISNLDNDHVQMRQFSYNEQASFADTIIHPNFQNPLSYYDVAVVKIYQHFEFNEYVRPICLPSEPSFNVDKYEGKQVTLTGWGKLRKNSYEFDGALRQIPIKVFSQEFCTRTHDPRTLARKSIITQRTIPYSFLDHLLCAGTVKLL